MKTRDVNLVVHGRESVELRSKVIHSVKGLQEVSQRQPLLPSMGQRRGCPDGILDLPTIDVPHRKFPNLLRGERHADLGQERVPNLRLRSRVKIVEVESDVDTRTEGVVDDLDSVGCEEEDPAVVLEVTEAERARMCERRSKSTEDKLGSQDCDHGIAHKIMKRALFHEHIRLRNR